MKFIKQQRSMIMSSPSPVFAAAWQEQLQEYHDQVPGWLARIGIPELRVMPELSIVADVAIALGAFVLLFALFRLLTLRIFRAFFCLLAALLMMYYPVAYGFHFWHYKYDEAAKAEREPTDVEKKIDDNIRYIDWGIMGGGVLIGGTIFLFTFGGRRRDEEEEEDYYTQQQQPAQQHYPQQRSRRRGGGQQQGKDPFDFS
jgi:hypothetical protein